MTTAPQAPAGYGGASADAIRHHYDLSNDFYALWLDPTMTYSCALWESPDETHEAAQLRKLDYLAGQAHAPGAARVLDVGCGWGSMMRRLIEQHGVARVTGLTLSPAQAESVSAWADERYDVRIENWINHEPVERYDAIVSIGAFEHFADRGMSRAGRVGAYRDFFDRCREWLPEGGRLALQTNVKGNNVRVGRRMVRELLFIIDRIFPESELPWTSELIEASERRFDLVSLRNDPDHYARTVRHWLAGLLAHRERAVELVGEAAVTDYERYLRSSIEAMGSRHLGLVRATFERVS